MCSITILLFGLMILSLGILASCILRKENYGGLLGPNRTIFVTKDPFNQYCLGQRGTKAGGLLKLYDRRYTTCDMFDTRNNEFVAVAPDQYGVDRNLSISAYYNADQDGRPLEYTDRWRGQKIVFEQVGSDDILGPYGVIRHVASGKCLHPSGGKASYDGQNVVVWGACNPEPRIMFYKIE